MDNPQSQSPPLSPRVMHDYHTHTNIPWNMTQYQVPALPFDYKKVVRDRTYASQKKGVKVNDFYVTKRGFYMDYELKVAAGVPSSAAHGKQEPWDGQKVVIEGDDLKAVRQSKKFTYLQRMEMEQAIHPIPGITTYKLQKSPEEKHEQHSKEKKISHGEKRYFHEDTHFLSDKVPGPGSYNPHQQVQKLHKSKKDWQYWTKRHNKFSSMILQRESKMPAPATYRPIYQSYRSFQQLQLHEKKQNLKRNGFGSDARFPYLRPNKKQIIERRPAPSAYQTKINWKGKSESPQKREWIKMVWKGSPPKVYH